MSETIAGSCAGPPPRSPSAAIARHAGLDWLRTGAFGLLILYHIGLYFGPWGWHINAVDPVPDLIYALTLLNPWRMTLLFVVSGYASRALLSRSAPGAFLRSRSVRLLVPLAFGTLLVVAPQPWVEQRVAGNYDGGLLGYWLKSYLSPHVSGTPTFDNLWFLVYIWAYSMVIGLVVWALPASARASLQRGATRLLSGWRLLALPILWLLMVRLVLLPTGAPTNRLLHDLSGHLGYFPAFLFGFLLARADGLRPVIRRLGGPAAMLAVAGYVVMAVLIYRLGGQEPASGTSARMLFRAAASVMNWGVIIALLALAERIGDPAPRWRPVLNNAVFPAYIVHQTAIVVVAWWLRPLGLPNGAQFVLILAGTAFACWGFYTIGRLAGPFGLLFGLSNRPIPRRSGGSGGGLERPRNPPMRPRREFAKQGSA
ncbi:acyltransferase family protein [Sphingomonas sp.]|uniref:acyltransferase family protein n=1 Tax=Sphingomonas sp. TaxID=28214 RepID=UPI003B3B05AA